MIVGDIEYLKSAYDIISELRQDLIAHNIDYLHDIKDGPKNVQITCPYHADGHERKPSAGIKKSSGVFHCFSCGETHSLPEVISYCFGKDGYEYGKRWLNIHIKERIYTSGRPHYKESEDIQTSSNVVSEKELDSYRYTHPYWAERGIVENWVITLFDLGYDTQRKMITFPVKNENGECEFVAKRSVKTKFFQYPKGVSKPLYGGWEVNAVAESGENVNPVFVCESMIDCILLWQSGHYATALNGLGNERQFKQLRELNCRTLILATDNDKAGNDARQRIRDAVQNKLISEIKFPKGIKDIGECSREQIDKILEWRVGFG